VRLQRFSEDGSLTAYWLWSHVRPDTRVIILDDPLVRAEESSSIPSVRYPDDMAYTGTGTNSWDE